MLLHTRPNYVRTHLVSQPTADCAARKPYGDLTRLTLPLCMCESGPRDYSPPTHGKVTFLCVGGEPGDEAKIDLLHSLIIDLLPAMEGKSEH